MTLEYYFILMSLYWMFNGFGFLLNLLILHQEQFDDSPSLN